MNKIIQSFKLDRDIVELIERDSKKKKVTRAEIVRQILEAHYFEPKKLKNS